MKVRMAAACLLATHLVSAFEMPPVQIVEDSRKPGTPYLHPPAKVLLGKVLLQTDTAGCTESNCSRSQIHAHTTHAGRVQTDTPIYAILTQPYHNDNIIDQADKFGNFKYAGSPQEALAGTFIMNSHIKYLQQGGARVVPISYRLNADQLNRILTQVNGVYIPGDTPIVLENERYLNKVRAILQWAQDKNKDDHFPIVALSYGYLALMMAGIQSQDTIKTVENSLMWTSAELNLRLRPEDTYLLDGYSLQTAESLLNNVTFYNELPFNVPLQRFLSERMLSKAFVPVATFNDPTKNQEHEFVALVEGAVFPFFGVAFSLEKFQFNQDLSVEDDIDHSKYAYRLAQRFANLFVDEARLSKGVFTQAADEYMALIQNYDSKVVSPSDNDYGLVGEIYIF